MVTPSPAGGVERRRSQRLSLTIPMEVSWTGEEGAAVNEPAETEVLNAHGALLRTKPHFPIPLLIKLRCQRTGMSTEARVVGFQEPSPEGMLRMAVELSSPSQSFWGLTIPFNEPGRIPRRHPRVRLVVQVESRTSGSVSLGRTENISVGGLLVHSPETFDPGTEVLARFNLPGAGAIEAEGRVVHSVPGVRMGIAFLKLDPSQQKAIEQFVQQACE